jgi:hypothetical protein
LTTDGSMTLTSMTRTETLEAMWQDYLTLNPEARAISELFHQKGEEIINDHIALRTFSGKELGISQVEKIFLNFGYERKGEYEFKEKKLFARHYEHLQDSKQPKIFISELLVEHFSPSLQEQVKKFISQMDLRLVEDPRFFYSGRPWQLSKKDYDLLAQESEYAAWLGAIGYRPNHFTVSFNHLNTFSSMEELNAFLKSQGHQLNSSGGELKGTPQDLLVQSSTMAQKVAVNFSDGVFDVPGCYFEFARRYPHPTTGELYQGFIAASADKIFESTDSKK